VRSIPAFIFFCIPFISCSPVGDKKIDIVHNWKIGEEYRVTILRNYKRQRKVQTPTLVIQCSFIRTSENKYDWMFERSYLDGISLQGLTPLDRYHVESFAGFKVPLTTDGKGKITHIDLDEATTFQNKYIDSLGRMKGENDSIIWSNKLLGLRPEEIEKRYLKEMIEVFELNGIELEYKKPVIRTSSLVAFYTPMECKDSLVFSSSSTKDFRVYRLIYADENVARKTMLEWNLKYGPKYPIQTLNDIPPVKVFKESEYILDADKERIKEIGINRSTIAGNEVEIIKSQVKLYQ
jgi:hypothetical protein